MKRSLLILVICLLCADFAFCQVKTEKFCKVTISVATTFDKKVICDVDFGKDPDMFNFKDTSVIVSLRKVKQLTSEVDVLNYMGSLGWEVVSIGQGNYIHNIYFKKEFLGSQIITN